jgi:large subunit ribosomal protein L17
MRHQMSGRHFNRDTNQRKALLKSLLCALVEHGEMVTTTPRAKELKRLADKLIHKAQSDTLTTRRVLHRYFGRRDVVNTLVDRIAPAMSDRSSGFTTISPVAKRRGDNVAMVKIQLVTKPEVVGTLKSGRTHKQEAAKKPAAKKSAKTVAEKPATAVKADTKAKPAAKKAAPKKAVSSSKKEAKKN